MNNSLLTDNKYIKAINTLLENCVNKYQNVENKALVWDTIKCEIRGTTIEFAINKAKDKRQFEARLKSEIKLLESELDHGEDVYEIYNTTKKELEQIEEEASRGSIIRSRAQWIEEGENCSKYFMQLENRNYKSKCITTLLTDKNTVTKQNETLEECKQFYENLYSGNVKCSLENCRFFDGEHNTLNDLDRNICEAKITIDECKL